MVDVCFIRRPESMYWYFLAFLIEGLVIMLLLKIDKLDDVKLSVSKEGGEIELNGDEN